MDRLACLAALLLACTGISATAAPARVGHYYLQGVMETGSELLLRDDGRFQWYLVVGALDLFAEGDWTATNDTVLLTAHKSEAVPSPAFETLTLRVDGANLVPPDGRGAYVLAKNSGD